MNYIVPTSRSAAVAIVMACLLIAMTGCSNSVPDPTGMQRGSGEPEIAFTDITEQAGLGDFHHENGAFGRRWYPEQMGSGGGLVDYNGDGWLDVVLVGGGTWPDYGSPVPGKHQGRPLWLYENNGDGTFTDVTEAAGLAAADAYGIGIAAADYDNDGDQDLLLTTLRENKLFRNDGGVFVEIGRESGLAGRPVWSSSAMFFDADRDGWLDLYVGNYVEWTPETDIFCADDEGNKAYCVPAAYEGIESRFYHNNGDGTFSDWTEKAGFTPALGKSLGVTLLDYNRDGWPDLMVANDGEGDLLYRNEGDGTFTEVGMRAGVAFSEHGEARAGMGIDAGDVDNSGKPSVFVGNFSEEMIGVYRHAGDGSFRDRAAISRIGFSSLQTLTFGLFLMDFDWDGYLDLFVANGHVYPYRAETNDDIRYRQQPQIFMNQGDGTFEELEQIRGGLLDRRLVARGAAYGDIDNDGDLDLLLTENDGPAYLWRNDRSGGRYLRVNLEGTRSNRDGIGTRIVAITEDERMQRWIRTGSSYLSQSEKTAVFGLGSARQVDSLHVFWPSGQIDHLTGVAPNQEITLTEGETAPPQELTSTAAAKFEQ